LLKKLLVLLLVSMLALGIFACNAQEETVPDPGDTESENPEEEAVEPIILKYSDINAEESYAGIFTEKFAELVEEKTNGRVIVETFYGGTLAGNDIEATQSGVADFSQHNVTEVIDLVPLVSILELPFTYETDEDIYKVTAADSFLMEEINSVLAPQGLRLLTTYSWGNQNILTTNKPIYSQADLNGLKIRVLPSDLYMDTMREMGAVPTPMAWGEVITSLVTGVIDGTGMPMIYIVSTSLHEIQQYYVMTNHNPTLSGVFMNQQTWEKITPEDQQNLIAAGEEARQFALQYKSDNLEEIRQAMLDQGMTIIEHDELDFDFVSIREAVFEIYREEWGDNYEKVLEMLE